MIAARWGRIVNIASSSAQTGNALQTHYAASKAGVIGLTRSLAKELGPKGITANAIPPGFVDTPMLRSSEEAGYLGPGSRPTRRPRPSARRPAEDICGGVRVPGPRQRASYITGQVIGVNGGRTIG